MAVESVVVSEWQLAVVSVPQALPPLVAVVASARSVPQQQQVVALHLGLEVDNSSAWGALYHRFFF